MAILKSLYLLKIHFTWVFMKTHEIDIAIKEERALMDHIAIVYGNTVRVYI